MSDETDAELVTRVSGGDREAFDTILRAQLGPVSRYVYRMTGNEAEAEDISQEVFLRLWTHASKFDPSKSKLTTWLHNIAHNLCIDHFRKSGRFAGEPDEDVGGGEEPDTATIAQALSDDVRRALLTLPERQRSALVMCHYQGLSNKDAASILDVSVDALESLLRRGRQSLRTQLARGEHL